MKIVGIKNKKILFNEHFNGMLNCKIATVTKGKMFKIAIKFEEEEFEKDGKKISYYPSKSLTCDKIEIEKLKVSRQNIVKFV